MILGVHTIIYADDVEAAGRFLKDTLGLSSVDSGQGWLIFALPPGEVAAHPVDERGETGRHEMCLMCDDVRRTVADLKRKGVAITQPVTDQGWGLLTRLRIPGAGEVGLYQPKHSRPASWHGYGWAALWVSPPCDGGAGNAQCDTCRLGPGNCVWERLRQVSSLSWRQVQFIRLILTANPCQPTEAAMATTLGITRGTVHRHLTRLYAKFGVTTRTDLVIAILRMMLSAGDRGALHA